MSKRRFRCGEEKPLGDFYRHPAMADGCLGKCKECTKADVRRNRRSKLDHYQAYDRKRGVRPSRAPKCPVKQKARAALGNAVRDGRVAKPDRCSKCGDTGRVEGHHHDYGKPLDVEWLCSRCHGVAHRKYLED